MWNTSCDPATDPAPDYGLSACNAADGTTPPWAPDMMGGIVRSVTVNIAAAGSQTVSIPLDEAAASRVASGASVLVSFVNASNEVQAFDVPITSASGSVGGTVPRDALAHAGRSGDVRRVHAGPREGLLRDDDGDRDLDRR